MPGDNFALMIPHSWTTGGQWQNSAGAGCRHRGGCPAWGISKQHLVLLLRSVVALMVAAGREDALALALITINKERNEKQALLSSLKYTLSTFLWCDNRIIARHKIQALITACAVPLLNRFQEQWASRFKNKTCTACPPWVGCRDFAHPALWQCPGTRPYFPLLQHISTNCRQIDAEGLEGEPQISPQLQPGCSICRLALLLILSGQ